jgi:hypothetical protein
MDIALIIIGCPYALGRFALTSQSKTGKTLLEYTSSALTHAYPVGMLERTPSTRSSSSKKTSILLGHWFANNCFSYSHAPI